MQIACPTVHSLASAAGGGQEVSTSPRQEQQIVFPASRWGSRPWVGEIHACAEANGGEMPNSGTGYAFEP